jgi:hypothetical protein
MARRLQFAKTGLVAAAQLLATPLASAAAGPQSVEPAAPKNFASLKPSAYLEQIRAPADWRTSPVFWLDQRSLIPGATVDSSIKVAVSDKGNLAQQLQSGTQSKEFILQWGRANVAVQRQDGNSLTAEIVQISPGATLVRGPNSGGGNGGEFDVFGNEVDPGQSSEQNRAGEPVGDSSGLGLGNLALQNQHGSVHFARAVQIGHSNVSTQLQTGAKHQSVVVQIGRGNRALVTQDGIANHSVVTQVGDGNTATVEQNSPQ